MKKTILFIEPDAHVREAVILLLGEKAYFVEVASLIEGLELLKITPVDLILSHEFASEIVNFKAPAVIFSAKLGLNREDLVSKGAVEAFSKIHDWNHFLGFLKNFLEG